YLSGLHELLLLVAVAVPAPLNHEAELQGEAFWVILAARVLINQHRGEVGIGRRGGNVEYDFGPARYLYVFRKWRRTERDDVLAEGKRQVVHAVLVSRVIALIESDPGSEEGTSALVPPFAGFAQCGNRVAWVEIVCGRGCDACRLLRGQTTPRMEVVGDSPLSSEGPLLLITPVPSMVDGPRRQVVVTRPAKDFARTTTHHEDAH